MTRVRPPTSLLLFESLVHGLFVALLEGWGMRWGEAGVGGNQEAERPQEAAPELLPPCPANLTLHPPRQAARPTASRTARTHAYLHSLALCLPPPPTQTLPSPGTLPQLFFKHLSSQSAVRLTVTATPSTKRLPHSRCQTHSSGRDSAAPAATKLTV